MTAPACPSFAGYRFPAEIISQAVWLSGGKFHQSRAPSGSDKVEQLILAQASGDFRSLQEFGGQAAFIAVQA